MIKIKIINLKRAALLFLYQSTYSDLKKCMRRRDTNKYIGIEILTENLKVLQKIMTEDFKMDVKFKELPQMRTIKEPPKHFFKKRGKHA